MFFLDVVTYFPNYSVSSCFIPKVCSFQSRDRIAAKASEENLFFFSCITQFFLLLHFPSFLIALPCSVSSFSLILPLWASLSPYLPIPFISFISSAYSSSASSPTTSLSSSYSLHMLPPFFPAFFF